MQQLSVIALIAGIQLQRIWVQGLFQRLGWSLMMTQWPNESGISIPSEAYSGIWMALWLASEPTVGQLQTGSIIVGMSARWMRICIMASSVAIPFKWDRSTLITIRTLRLSTIWISTLPNCSSVWRTSLRSHLMCWSMELKRQLSENTSLMTITLPTSSWSKMCGQYLSSPENDTTSDGATVLTS